jgi:hypothetical protein
MHKAGAGVDQQLFVARPGAQGGGGQAPAFADDLRAEQLFYTRRPLGPIRSILFEIQRGKVKAEAGRFAQEGIRLGLRAD